MGDEEGRGQEEKRELIVFFFSFYLFCSFCFLLLLFLFFEYRQQTSWHLMRDGWK